jgi:hypothetical protein
VYRYIFKDYFLPNLRKVKIFSIKHIWSDHQKQTEEAYDKLWNHTFLYEAYLPHWRLADLPPSGSLKPDPSVFKNPPDVKTCYLQCQLWDRTMGNSVRF